MARYECLASNLRDWCKISLYQSIEADSAQEALRVFGQFVGTRYREHVDSLGELGREAYCVLPIASEDVEAFVVELVRAASPVRGDQGDVASDRGVEFVASYAELGEDAPFFVHLWTRVLRV